MKKRLLIFALSGLIGMWAAVGHAVVGPSTQSVQPPALLIVKFKPMAAAVIENSLSAVDLAVSGSNFPYYNHLRSLIEQHKIIRVIALHPDLIREKRRTGRSELQISQAIRSKFSTRGARAVEEVRDFGLSRTFVLDMGAATEEMIKTALMDFQNSSEVEYADRVGVYRAQFTPNDPYFSSIGSWGQGYDDLYGMKKISSSIAWDSSRGLGIVVAVVDTGLDRQHPDIAANVWTNPNEIPINGIDDDNNGYVDDVQGWDFVSFDNDPSDSNGHGTHVAGTIAAVGQNSLGVIGVAWKAKVMPIQGLDSNGSGFEFQLVAAIRYAVNNGADVINCSWGGRGANQAIEDVINYAHNLGTVVVAAAGNVLLAQDASEYFPAGITKVITVSAFDPADNIATFSNRGTKIDVAAPGVDIMSLRAANTFLGQLVGTQYMRLNGTSMAAPHVAGLAALILSKNPTFTNEQVRQAMRVSARDVADVGFDAQSGYGRIDAGAAVALSNVLEAKIITPAFAATISGLKAVNGYANGPTFSRYLLEYGVGENPTTWTVIHQSTTPVVGPDGLLGFFDTSLAPEGKVTLRLIVTGTDQKVYTDRLIVDINYVEVHSPIPVPTANAISSMKTGVRIPVRGAAMGQNFQSYQLEWASGVNPDSGWSGAGVTLVNGGSVQPAFGSELGSWDTSVVSTYPGACYTLRLTVNYAGISRVERTFVYLEPDLLSNKWPQWIDTGTLGASVLRGKNATGQSRLVVTSAKSLLGGLGKYRRFSPDGTLQVTRDLSWGMFGHQSAIANFDGLAGDEAVTGDGFGVRMIKLDGSSFAFTPSLAHTMYSSSHLVADDLDGDGKTEVLAVAGDFLQPATTTNLYVWNTDGSQATLAFSKPVPGHNPFIGSSFGNQVLTVDLNGNGKKEILVFQGISGGTFSIKAFNFDGSEGAWPLTEYNGRPYQWAAGDLDRDGQPEIILAHSEGGCIFTVFSASGALRPGWPQSFPFPLAGNCRFAVADMDGSDHQDEIIFSGLNIVQILRSDGTPWASPTAGWPFLAAAGTTFGPVAIGDVDGGRPEILFTSSRAYVSQDIRTRWQPPLGASEVQEQAHVITTVEPEGTNGLQKFVAHVIAMATTSSSPFFDFDNRLLAVGTDGTVHKFWRVQGLQGEQSYTEFAAPLIGDFDGDGKVDVALSYMLRTPTADVSTDVLIHGALMALTANTAYSREKTPWPSNFHDAKNTASRFLPRSKSVTPSSGTGAAGTFTPFVASYSHLDGWRKHATTHLLFNTSLNSTSGVYVQYNQNKNLLSLRKQDLTGWLECTPGQALILETNLVRLDCARTSITHPGVDIRVRWGLTFKPDFAGSPVKKVYMSARDDDNMTDGWVQKGTWQVAPSP